jgi:PAS domain S-box-containing protein
MPTLEPEVIDGTLDTTNQQLAELLKESEERFRLLADATPVMIWMAGSDQLCDYFNSVWLEFTGCPLEQQLGSGWTQGIHPEDKEQHQDIYSTAFKARRKFQIEYRLRRADGEYRWVLDTGVPRFTPKGSFVGYIGSCVDITERKQAEEKLSQKTAEADLRLAIEQLQKEIAQRVQVEEALIKQQQQQQVILDAVPAMIWFKDTENRILHANQAAAKAMGWRVEELEGKSNDEISPDEAAKYHQDDLEVINSGSPKLGIIEPLQTASGEKRWIQTDKIPWRDHDGKIAGVIVFAIDLTERQKSQLLLQESLTRFDLVATASQEGLWDAWVVADDLDNPNNPVYYSPRFKELLGYEDYEFENTLGSWTSRIHPEDRDRVLVALTAHLTQKTPYRRIEYRILTKSGEYRWFSASGQAIWDVAGNPVRIAGALRDITVRKQAEAERDALRAASQRFFNVSVDILCTAGFDGYFMQVNPAVTTVLGYTPEEFMAVPCLELVHPEDRARTELEVQKLASGAHSLLFENRYRCKDGSYKWLAWNAVPFLEEQLIYCSARDITKRKQAEKALRESERRFQTLARVSPVGIFYTDAQGQGLYVNERWCEIAGLTPAEAAVEGWLKAIHPDDREQVLTRWDRAAQANLPFQSEHRFRRPDGKVTWVLAQAIAELNEAGVVKGYVGTITDISDRKALEKELALRQAHFNAFFASAPAGLMILDDQLRFAHINETLAYMNQRDVADHLGRTLTEVVPTIASILVPMFRQILTTGEPILNHELSAEGTKQPGAKLHCMASYFPLIGEEGKPIGIGAVIIEITERKRAEAALRESEARLGAIFNQAAVGIKLTELNGSCLLVNQKLCELVGYAQEEMHRRTFQEITHPEDLDADLEYTRQLLAGEIQTFSMDKRYLHKQGSSVWVNLTVSLVRSPEGEPKYMISIIKDIGDRKALEKELALRQARFDAFFTTAPVGLEIIDDQLRFAHINETLAEMDGCSVAEHLGKTITEIVPAMASGLNAMYQHILNTGESILNVEETGETPKEPGVLRHWISSRFPLLGEEGKPIAVGGVTMEITERKRTEEALKESEAQLRLALNAAQMGVWDWNMKTGSVTFSEREEAILGFASGEFDGRYKTYFNRIHPEDRSRVTQMNQNTIEEKADYDIDYRIIWPDGTIHWLREKGAVLHDETGKAVRMIGITMDITDRKQAQESLRQSEERYRKLAQQAELLYRIASQIRNSLNLDTILETAVVEIRNLLQIDRCHFIWYCADADSAMWQVVHEAKPTDQPSLSGCYAAEALEPLIQPLLNFEVLRVDDVQNLQDDATREFFQSLGYKSLLYLPIQTPSGKVGVVACVNCNGLRSWNDEEVELVSVVCDQLAIAINQAELYAKSRAAASVATEKATQLELALHSLQQTQFQLIQTEKMSSLGQLVAGVAHEINNPVTFISGNVDHASDYIKNLLNLLELYRTVYPQPTPEIQVLAQTIDLDFLLQDLPKVISSMKVGADRIRDLVLSLRNFSRLDEAEKKLVDIHEGLDNTLLILQHRLRQKSGYPAIQVIKEYGQLPLVNCYPGQLNQVFMNLLTNAIDALESVTVSTIPNPTPPLAPPLIKDPTAEASQIPNPEIQICTGVNTSGEITIRIADNGLGMTQDVLARLFDPFFTTKPIGKGTGLGLSISYQIVVEKHKGTLHCNSEPGKGSEFVVTLPQYQDS